MTSRQWRDCGKLAVEYNEEEWERIRQPRGRSDIFRTPFEIDRDRIIHSPSFRRLQGKTQVFGMGSSDFFRTRLTHSLEAAQIGKGIAISTKCANTDLVEAACLAHDIGHPPFGHTGESVLKDLMKDDGGFEGNAQNLRLLNKLEIRTADADKRGLNISRATIDAILKYKTLYSNVNKQLSQDDWKFLYDEDKTFVEWAAHGAPGPYERSIECLIMNWADDIAYSCHDLEDGMKAGMINKSKITADIERKVHLHITQQEWNKDIWNQVTDEIANVSKCDSELEKKGRRKDLISKLIYSFIDATKAKRRGGNGFPSRYQFTLDINPDIKLKCNMLKFLVRELIINDEHVATKQRKATIIVGTLFKEFTRFDESDRTREMYPADFRERLDAAFNKRDKLRVACDFISGMTDNYATRMYARLTESEAGSLFDII